MATMYSQLDVFKSFTDSLRKVAPYEDVSVDSIALSEEYLEKKSTEFYENKISYLFFDLLSDRLFISGFNLIDNFYDHDFIKFTEENYIVLFEIKQKIQESFNSSLRTYQKALKFEADESHNLKTDLSSDTFTNPVLAREEAYSEFMKSRRAEEYMRYVPYAYHSKDINEIIVALQLLIKTDVYNPHRNGFNECIKYATTLFTGSGLA